MVRQAMPTTLKPWLPAIGTVVMGWFALDGLLRLSHLPIASGLTLAGLGLGASLLRRRQPRGPAPTDVPGWLGRLEQLEGQFLRLAGESTPAKAELNSRMRQNQLATLRQELDRQGLQLALVGTCPPALALQPDLIEALRGAEKLQLHWAHPLPAWSTDWSWPEAFAACDLLIHHLRTPLSAADLRWLEALPAAQPAWLLVEFNRADQTLEALAAELRSQLGQDLSQRLLFWNGLPTTLTASISPLARHLASAGEELRRGRQLRRLEQLHGLWQCELEQLRRQHFLPLQRRTQWLVAAGVVAAPLPSLDLLVLAVANGLMLREMARLWDCPWTFEQLQAAASELAKAALAQGVVEWSSQLLTGLVKLHGATWLVGGALQALSAAYLTRVVARSMADMLALSAGVSEPDLAEIKRQAPLLVAKAAAAEKLDWPAFLEQGRQWLRNLPPASMNCSDLMAAEPPP
jgi:uncharacterized protein (DUF697 family)